MLFALDLLLIGWLTFRAYRDGKVFGNLHLIAITLDNGILTLYSWDTGSV